MGRDVRGRNSADVFLYQRVDIRWIRSCVVAVINAEGGTERSKVAFGHSLLCFRNHIGKPRNRDRAKNGDDRDHDHEFN